MLGPQQRHIAVRCWMMLVYPNYSRQVGQETQKLAECPYSLPLGIIQGIFLAYSLLVLGQSFTDWFALHLGFSHGGSAFVVESGTVFGSVGGTICFPSHHVMPLRWFLDDQYILKHLLGVISVSNYRVTEANPRKFQLYLPSIP